jgi:TPR repeat protein
MDLHLLNTVFENNLNFLVLGSMLITGELGFEDEETGLTLLEMAAEGGHASAIALLKELSAIETVDEGDDEDEEDFE